MIRIFSKLKKLELDDRHVLSQFTKQFPPYNDFEFLSLWLYNIENKNSFYSLNNNLVIKIQDFITGKFFYSFLGTNKVKATITTLLAKSKEENLCNQLRLVPEINLQSSPELRDYFSIKEDTDSFDYILSVDEIANLKGNKYYDKRNLVNRFNKLYLKHTLEILDFNKEKIKQDIIGLFFRWEHQKGKDRKETQIELTAIKKLIDFANIHNIIGLGVYFEAKLIGFVSYHMVHENYALMSFEKGDTSYKGIYEYLHHQAAKHLKTLGAKYINYEQDLGIPGLKKAKTLWRPIFFLKKYTIEPL